MEFLTTLADLLSGENKSAPSVILRFAIIILLTAVAVKVVTSVFKRIERNRRAAGRTFGYVRVARYALLGLIYAAAVAAVVSGNAKQTVSAVIASSGVAAVVLSIACQEPIGNLCSGLIIMLTSPFKIGDIIRHIGLNATGTVEEITLRHTVIRTAENKRLFIPNSDMNKAAIENSNYGEARLYMPLEFTITYETNIDVAIQVVTNVILRHPSFDDAQAERDRAVGKDPVGVLVNRFEDSGIVLKVWVWAENLSSSYAMKSDILREVHKHFKYAHVEFAYPHMEIVKK
jgi:small-conductance mechanosensitive channel